MILLVRILILCCTLLIIIAVDTDDIRINFERVELKFPDSKVYRGNITNRKYNRTTLVTDAHYDQLVWLKPGECTVKISAYQFLSNTYRLSSIQFEIDYCMTLSGDETHQEYHNNSNFPTKCPIAPGKYYVKDAVLPSVIPKKYGVTVPPNFLGKWKLVLDNLLNKKSYYVYNLYFALERKVKWKG